ncbi:hypothetical protein Tco_0918462 [Tanacetum coccineum]
MSRGPSNHPLCAHFINNDLEYLKGGSSSRKYTTSITKTKAADYGHVKWIEDKIPRSTWSEVQVVLCQAKALGNILLRVHTSKILWICYRNMENLPKTSVLKGTDYRLLPSLKIRNLFGYKEHCERHASELHKVQQRQHLNHVSQLPISMNIATGIQMEYLPKRKKTQNKNT